MTIGEAVKFIFGIGSTSGSSQVEMDVEIPGQTIPEPKVPMDADGNGIPDWLEKSDELEVQGSTSSP